MAISQRQRELELQLQLMEVEIRNLKLFLELNMESGRQDRVDFFLDQLSAAIKRQDELRKSLSELKRI